MINSYVTNIGQYTSLEQVPTKLLLKWRNRAYACSGGVLWRGCFCRTWPCDCGQGEPKPDHQIRYDPTESGGSEVTLADLKAELAKRPHIPNKLEGKRLRREAAKRKQ